MTNIEQIAPFIIVIIIILLFLCMLCIYGAIFPLRKKNTSEIQMIEEAYGVISEYELNEDDFIAKNFRQFLHNGEPDDNSIELHNIYGEHLRIIVSLGLKEAKKILKYKINRKRHE